MQLRRAQQWMPQPRSNDVIHHLRSIHLTVPAMIGLNLTGYATESIRFRKASGNTTHRPAKQKACLLHSMMPMELYCQIRRRKSNLWLTRSLKLCVNRKQSLSHEPLAGSFWAAAAGCMEIEFPISARSIHSFIGNHYMARGKKCWSKTSWFLGIRFWYFAVKDCLSRAIISIFCFCSS